MSRQWYLPLDLEVFELAANVARAGGLTFEQAFAGLCVMWKHCWLAKADVVTASHLRGFFGSASPLLVEALESFGFLERFDDTGWRVKGARDRILRVKTGLSEAARAARVKGGKAAAENLKQNRPVQPDMLGGEDKPAGEAQPRAMSVHQQHWAAMQAMRSAHLEVLGINDAKTETHSAARINASLGKLAKALAQRDEMTFDGSEIPALWGHYLDWDAPAGDSPPWPLNKFLSQGVIDSCVRAYVKELDEGIAASEPEAERASA